MNPPLSEDDALTQLKLLTSQSSGSGNFTFTDDELTQALEIAWNDTYNVIPVWDDSIALSSGTWQYAIPDTVTTVVELYFERTSTDFPERISPELYEIVDGNIQFLEWSQKWLDGTYTLFIKGWLKLTTDDDLPDTNHVNFVLWHAAETLLQNLMFKKAFYFLKTDTNMADIRAALQQAQANTLRFKQALLRQFESA